MSAPRKRSTAKPATRRTSITSVEITIEGKTNGAVTLGEVLHSSLQLALAEKSTTLKVGGFTATVKVTS